MVERWNIGFQKDISHFNFIVNPAGGGTINPALPFPLRAIGSTLRPVSPTDWKRSRRPEPIIPIFQHPNIPVLNQFDFALMVTTVCFVDDIRKALLEVHRVLSNEGILIIGFVDRNNVVGQTY